MTEQLELLDRPVPEVAPEEVRALMQLLRGRGWMRAREILLFADSMRRDWDDRVLREIRRAARGAIISGNKGYKLTDEAELEEIRASNARKKSQVDEMMQDIVDTERYYHDHEYRRRHGLEARP